MNRADNYLNRLNMVSVVGLGYVGLPLAIAFGKKNIKVIGIDKDGNKIDLLKEGKSYIGDVSNEDVQKLVESGYFVPTTEYSHIINTDAVIICVPTPLRKSREPDISYVLDAADRIKEYIHKGLTIILESTVYPGVTDEILLPLFESSGLKCGRDFFLAFSPERVDPGRKDFTLKNTPKVVGGVDTLSTEKAVAIYRKICDKVIKVSSSKVAEMVKLLENTFRAVNIGLVNEIAKLCDEMEINVWEVVDAAATKPYGYMKFTPGPGIGGHCIPIDPLYLSWKAKSYGFTTRFINLADEINQSMQKYVVLRIADCLNTFRKSINGSNIFILGVAYKKDVSDIRESPAFEIMRLLLKKGANLYYNDPFVETFKLDGKVFHSVELSREILQKSDCIVILTDHSVYNYDFIVESSEIIFDTRNATKSCKTKENVFLL